MQIKRLTTYIKNIRNNRRKLSIYVEKKRKHDIITVGFKDIMFLNERHNTI
jgi:hypothetical protein